MHSLKEIIGLLLAVKDDLIFLNFVWRYFALMDYKINNRLTLFATSWSSTFFFYIKWIKRCPHGIQKSWWNMKPAVHEHSNWKFSILVSLNNYTCMLYCTPNVKNNFTNMLIDKLVNTLGINGAIDLVYSEPQVAIKTVKLYYTVS